MTQRSTATTSPGERFRPDLIIVDGRNLLFRCADAHRDLSVQLGEADRFPTGGVYGFLNVLTKVKQRYGGAIVIAWEGTDNFRYKLWPNYKNKHLPRAEHVEQFANELSLQETVLVDIMCRLGVKQFGGVGGEADDVIGTLADRFTDQDVGIFSNDSDLRQLVHDKRMMYTGWRKCICPGYGGKDVLFGVAEVNAKYGVPPERIPDLKALGGDSSDGIPGVPGIGEKTAAQMLQTYGDLAGVIRAADEPRDWKLSERFRQLILAHGGNLDLFLQLTTIKRDIKLTSWPARPDPMEARRLMYGLKFKSLLEAGPFTDLKRLSHG